MVCLQKCIVCFFITSRFASRHEDREAECSFKCYLVVICCHSGTEMKRRNPYALLDLCTMLISTVLSKNILIRPPFTNV